MQHLRSFTSIILVCQGGVYFGGARRKIASANVAIASDDATHHEHHIEEHAIASNAATEARDESQDIAQRTILKLEIDNKISGFDARFKSLQFYRGSSACWGIPGTAPQSDGSWNLIPDESNFACSRDPEYYSAQIIGLNLGFGWDFKNVFQEKVVDIKFQGTGRNESGTISWTYSCFPLSNEGSRFQGSCTKADDGSFKVTLEAASASSLVEGAAEKYTRAHTVKFFKADAVESEMPLPPKEYPDALQGVIWMDQIGAYGYSDITSGAPDAAVSFGDPANVLDAENKRINVDVSGTAFQWFNNFEGYAAWKLLHSINFKYIFQFNDDYTHAQIDPSVSVFSVPKSFTSFTMELQTPQPGECPPAEGATKQEISKCAKWKRISTVAGGEEKLYYVFEIIDKDGKRVQPYYNEYVKWVNSHVDPDSGSAWWAGVRGEGLEDPSNSAFVGLESTEH